MMIEALWAFLALLDYKISCTSIKSWYPVEVSCTFLQRFCRILFIQVTKNRAKMVIALFNLLEFMLFFDYKMN